MDDSESAEAFLDTFSLVVSFLQREGFSNAEKALLREFQTKYHTPEADAEDSEDADRSGGSNRNEPSPDEVDGSGATSEASMAAEGAVATAQLRVVGSSSSGAPEPFSPQEVHGTKDEHAASPVVPYPAFVDNSDKRKYEKSMSQIQWEPDVDEYEDNEDVGYFRRDVCGQAHFVEAELDLHEEEGSEKFFTHAPGSNNQHDDVDVIYSDEHESDVDSELGTSTTASLNQGKRSTSKLSEQGSITQERACTSIAPQDKAWDLGPMDIRLTEPVTTPTKASVDKTSDETRPVLSRVESLSSSFMDFDIERDGEEGGLPGRLSRMESEDPLSEVSGLKKPTSCHGGQIEPSGLDLEGFTAVRQASSHLSEVSDVSEGEAGAADVECGGWRGGEAKARGSETKGSEPEELAGDKSSSALDPSPDGSAPMSPPAAGAAFSFQFPVAAVVPPAVVPQAPLFKSWTSAPSSSVGDDDSPNEYADDEYHSRLSSRAHSRSRCSTPPPPVVELHSEDVTTASGLSRKNSQVFASPEGGSAADDAAADVNLPSSGNSTTAQTNEQQQSDGSASATASAAATAAAASSSTVTQAAGEGAAVQVGTGSKAVAPDLVAHRIKITQSQDDIEEGAEAPSADLRKLLDMSPTSSGGAREGVEMVSAGVRSISSDADAFAHHQSSEAAAGAVQKATDAVDTETSLQWQVVTPSPPDDDEDGSLCGVDEASLSPAHSGVSQAIVPSYTLNEDGGIMYHYDSSYIERKYEVFDLRIIHRRHRTGFEETKDFPIKMNALIAGRYQVMDFLGSAAFSRAVQALDVKTGTLVCLKIIKNNKDYFDQSLDEIKLLKYVNSMDPNDQHGLVRLYDYFYYKEHLFLVCELLRANLYEFQKYNRESNDEPYFTNARIQRITISVLRSLAFMHSLGLVHSDLKPENILIKSYSRCEVKVIDLGSSCFVTDQLSSYVQSRSYRAPEVILGLPYDQKVDVWSLGCILAELSSGFVLLQNDSLASLLARLEGILGPIPSWMIQHGRYAHRFYTRSGQIFERSPTSERYELLAPKRSSLRHRMPDADEGLVSFVGWLLSADPRTRPTALEALSHPWLQHQYPSLDGN